MHREGEAPGSPATGRRSFRINLVANGVGAVVTSIVQFLLVRLYLRQLGVEAYGLIGVQATLWTIVQLADVGISGAVNRELARKLAVGGGPRDVRDMVRTLEVGYAGVGLLLGLAVALAAPFAETWLHHERLSGEMVRRSVQAMGLLVAAQWPLSFYQGALLGLQRHGLFNAVRIGMAIATAAGAYVVLTHVSTTPLALFLWQAAMGLGQVGLLALCTWRCLPRDDPRPVIRPSSVSHLWRVAAGMFALTATALILSQMDRVVASRLLPLETFGAYMLGATLANALLFTFNGPVYASVFPRLASLAALGDVSALRQAYQRDWALMVTATVPAAVAIAASAQPLLLAWTGDAAAAGTASPIAVLLIVGMALNGLGSITQALLLAGNWARPAVVVNVGLCLVAGPALWLLGRSFGAVGVAAVWPAVNLCYVIIGLFLAHRRLGPAPDRGWLLRDVALPTAGAVAIVWLWQRWLPATGGLLQTVMVIGSAWALAVATVVLLSPPMFGSARRALGGLTASARGPLG